MKETEIAAPIVEWFRDLKFEVYQEVQLSYGGDTADIVAVFGKLVWVVETKTTFGLRVIEQAENWKRYANKVSVGVPPFGWRGQFKRRICKMLGIGILNVYNYGTNKEVKEHLFSPIYRKAKTDKILSMLTDRHKTYAVAGNSEGRRLTPFKNTCFEIARFVKDSPGCTVKELIDKVPTHYHSVVSARSCISRYLKENVIEGVRGEKKNGEWRVYPVKEKK